MPDSFDTSGALRAETAVGRRRDPGLRGGWSFIDAVQWWDPADRTMAPVVGRRQQPARIDLSSGRTYPFEPASALFLADFAGPLAELSPRRVQLTRIVERAAAARARRRRGLGV